MAFRVSDDPSDRCFADYTWLIPDVDVVDSDAEGETGAVGAEVLVVEAAKTKKRSGTSTRTIQIFHPNNVSV